MQQGTYSIFTKKLFAMHQYMSAKVFAMHFACFRDNNLCVNHHKQKDKKFMILQKNRQNWNWAIIVCKDQSIQE